MARGDMVTALVAVRIEISYLPFFTYIVKSPPLWR